MEKLMATKVVYFRDILTSELGFELVFRVGFRVGFRVIVRSLSAKYGPDRYRCDKRVKFCAELPWHLLINNAGGALYKRF